MLLLKFLTVAYHRFMSSRVQKLAIITAATFIGSIATVEILAQESLSELGLIDSSPIVSDELDPARTDDTVTQPIEPTSTEKVAERKINIDGAILKTIDSTIVAAQISGILQEINVKEGTSVKQDQLLGKIKDEAIQIQLDQLKSQVLIAQRKTTNDIDKRLAEKSREVTENELQRAIAANARVSNTYPLNEIDRLRLVAERAKLEVERAAYNIEMAGLELSVAVGEYKQSQELLARHQINAPMTGVVVAVEKRTGEWVEPGTELIRIVRLDTLRVEGFISAKQDDLNLVGKKATVALRDSNKPITIEGKVVFVSPDVNPVNSQIRVFVEIDNSDSQLRPGSQVLATIEL